MILGCGERVRKGVRGFVRRRDREGVVGKKEHARGRGERERERARGSGREGVQQGG